MNRLVIIGGLVVAGLAIAVYRAKLGAEETQEKIDGLKAEATAINKEISVMKAEEAYLTRPERIAPSASRTGACPRRVRHRARRRTARRGRGIG